MFDGSRLGPGKLGTAGFFFGAIVLVLIIPLLILLPAVAWAAGIGDVVTSVSKNFSQAEFEFGTEEITGLDIKMHACWGGIAGGYGAATVVGPIASGQNPTVIKAVDLAAGSTGVKSIPLKGAQVNEYTMSDGVGLLVNLSDYVLTVEIYESGKGNAWDFQTARKIAQETLDGLENSGILGRAAPKLAEETGTQQKEQPEEKQGQESDTAAGDRAVALEEPAVVSSTMNIMGVYNGAKTPATFTFDRPHLITQISDYHWNNARGITPGTIGFKDSSGKQYGPWQATGRLGQGGVPDAYWDVFPNIVVPAGTYTIIDSDPSTWSQNSESGGQGMSDVFGTPNFEVVGGSVGEQSDDFGIPGTLGHGSGESPGGVGSVGNIPGPESTTEAVVGVVVPGALATLLGALAGLGGGGGAPAGGGIPLVPTTSGGGGTTMPQSPPSNRIPGVETASQLGRRRSGGSTVSGLGRKKASGSLQGQPDIYIDTTEMHEGVTPLTAEGEAQASLVQETEGAPEIFIDTVEEIRDVPIREDSQPEIFIDTEEEMGQMVIGQDSSHPDIFIEPEAEMQEILFHKDVFIDTSGVEDASVLEGILYDGEAGAQSGLEQLSQDEMTIFEDPTVFQEDIPVTNGDLDKAGAQEQQGVISGEQEPGVLGSEQEGFDSEGFNEQGFDQEGFDREGFSEEGFDRGGYDREGFDKEGFDSAGYDKEGFNKEGFDSAGYDKEGFNREGFDSEGFNEQGFDKQGFDKEGYNRRGFDEEGFDREGFNQYGFDRNGYNREGFDRQGYNANGYDRDGYDRWGFDAKGFDRKGFDQEGFNAKGLDRDGFDRQGFDVKGFDKEGFDRDGFDANGFDKEGYDKLGFDQSGVDREGFDRKGFDQEGFDREGFARNGFDREGYGRNGFDKYGYDREGYDINGYNQKGYNRSGYNAKGYDAQGYDRDGFNKDGWDRDGYGRDGLNRAGYDREGYDKNGYDQEGYNRDGFDKNGRQREGYDADGYDKNGFNEHGYDRDGYDREGFNYEGYNRGGYDPWGYDKQGYGKDGYHWSGYNADGYNKYGRHWSQNPYEEDDSPFNILVSNAERTFGEGKVVPFGAEPFKPEWKPEKPRLGEPYPKTVEKYGPKPWTDEPQVSKPQVSEPTVGKPAVGVDTGIEPQGPSAGPGLEGQAGEGVSSVGLPEGLSEGLPRHGDTIILKGTGDGKEYPLEYNSDTGKWENLLTGGTVSNDELDSYTKDFQRWQDDLREDLRRSAEHMEKMATRQDAASIAIDDTLDKLKQLDRMEELAIERNIGNIGGPGDVEKAIQDLRNDIVEGRGLDQDKMDKIKKVIKHRIQGVSSDDTGARWEEVPWYKDLGSALQANAATAKEVVTGQKEDGSISWLGNLARLMIVGATGGAATSAGVVMDGGLTVAEAMMRIQGEIDKGETDFRAVAKAVGIVVLSEQLSWMASKSGGAIWGEMLERYPVFSNKLADSIEKGALKIMKADQAASAALGMVSRESADATISQINKRLTDLAGDSISEGLEQAVKGVGRGTVATTDGAVGRATRTAATKGGKVGGIKGRIGGEAGDLSQSIKGRPSAAPKTGRQTAATDVGGASGKKAVDAPQVQGKTGAGAKGAVDPSPRKPGAAAESPSLPPRKPGAAAESPGGQGKGSLGPEDATEVVPNKGIGKTVEGPGKTGPVTSDIPTVNQYYTRPSSKIEADNYAHINMDVERVRETMAKNHLQVGDSGAVYAAPPKAGVPAYEFTSTTTVRISKDHLVDVRIKTGPKGNQFVTPQGQVIDPSSLRDKVLMTPAPEGTGVILTYYDANGNVCSYVPAKFLERWSNATNSFTPMG